MMYKPNMPDKIYVGYKCSGSADSHTRYWSKDDFLNEDGTMEKCSICDGSGCDCCMNGYVPSGATKYIRADKAIPEGYALVPIEATAENGMKAALIGDIVCNITPTRQHTISWDDLKKIYKAMITAAQSGGKGE